MDLAFIIEYMGMANVYQDLKEFYELLFYRNIIFMVYVSVCICN